MPLSTLPTISPQALIPARFAGPKNSAPYPHLQRRCNAFANEFASHSVACDRFSVALANDYYLLLANISGKMPKRFIRLTVGDRVRMEMSAYNTAKARLVYRL